MQCDSVIYEEVESVSHEVHIKKNECYEDHVIKTAPDTSTNKTSDGRRKHVAVGLTFTTLVLLLGAVAAITGYALAEISHLKSAMVEMSATLESRMLHFGNHTAESIEALDARISLVQNSTLQGLNHSISQMAAVLEAKITQVRTSSRDAAEQIATSISVLQQQSTQNYTVLDTELRSLNQSSGFVDQRLNTSISIMSVILGQGSSSCDTLPASSPAGYYNFSSANGSLLHQYCPPISTRCGLPGRWQTIADLDMTNSTHQCYSPLQQHTYSNKRLCVRSSELSRYGCTSVQLFITAVYKSVCGLVKAYQFGRPEAFWDFEGTINSVHVDGVIFTHGSPRQHIWTFAATANENSGHTGCPCMGGRDRRPRFVKNDYFCDTGTSNGTGGVFYGDNPLWDGAGCGPTNSCCDFNDPPWFYKELPQYTNDDIELRLCNSNRASDEDIAIEKIEIYVK